MLNEVNHSDRVRYAVLNPAKPGKVLERISTADHKIFILVGGGRHGRGALVPCIWMRSLAVVKMNFC